MSNQDGVGEQDSGVVAGERNEEIGRATWRQWVPDIPEPPLSDLHTRADILAFLVKMNVMPEVTESDLRYWENRGILPQPVRRRKDGATRALYPLWYVSLVHRLRAYQRHTFKLEGIAARLQADAQQLARDDSLTRPGLPPELAAALAGWPEVWPFRPVEGLAAEVEGLLGILLASIATPYREQHGVILETAEIYLKDRHGEIIPYHIKIPSPTEVAMYHAARKARTVAAQWSTTGKAK